MSMDFLRKCRVQYWMPSSLFRPTVLLWSGRTSFLLSDWFIINGLKLAGLRHSLRMRRTVKLSLEDHNVSNYWKICSSSEFPLNNFLWCNWCTKLGFYSTQCCKKFSLHFRILLAIICEQLTNLKALLFSFYFKLINAFFLTSVMQDVKTSRDN